MRFQVFYPSCNDKCVTRRFYATHDTILRVLCSSLPTQISGQGNHVCRAHSQNRSYKAERAQSPRGRPNLTFFNEALIKLFSAMEGGAGQKTNLHPFWGLCRLTGTVKHERHLHIRLRSEETHYALCSMLSLGGRRRVNLDTTPWKNVGGKFVAPR